MRLIANPILQLSAICRDLVSSEILRQDPVEDVIMDVGEGSVNHLSAASLRDALRDGPSVGCIG